MYQYQKQGCKARLTLNLEIQEIVKINNDHNHNTDVVALAHIGFDSHSQLILVPFTEYILAPL